MAFGAVYRWTRFIRGLNHSPRTDARVREKKGRGILGSLVLDGYGRWMSMIVWIIYKTSGIAQEWKTRGHACHLENEFGWICYEVVTRFVRFNDVILYWRIKRRVFLFCFFEVVWNIIRRKLSHCGTRFSWSNIYGNEILCLALEFGIRVGDTWPEQRFQGMDCFRGGKFVLVKFALSDARRCITSWLKIIISRESFRWDARKGDENAQFFDKMRFVLFAWID